MEHFIPPLLKKGDYIFGSFVKSSQNSGFINDGNPGDRSDQIGRFPFSLQNAKEAIHYANTAQEEWRTTPLSQRLQTVNSYQQELESREKFLIHVLMREIGIPIWEARQEVLDTRRMITDLISAATKIFISPSEDGVQTNYYPIGTLAMLSPFSQPLMLPSLFSCAAVLTGNSIVHKPSKYTPGIGQAIAEIWDRCRLLRGLYNMVQGPGSHIGQYILSHPKIQGALFAGSYSSAEEIQKKNTLPPHLPFIAFLGGKSSAIVTESSRLEHVVHELITGAFRYTGQRPTAIARVFVSRAVARILTDSLAKSIDQLNVGYGKDQQTYLGPMVSEHWRTRYHRYGHSLYSNGHTPVRQTENLENNRRGYYVKPALYKVNWTNGSPMLADEPPGPILLIYEVNDVQEAIALHNQLRFRRLTSLFCEESPAVVNNLLSQIHTGGVFVNSAPKETSFPVGAQGLSANTSGSGVDLLHHLVRKQVCFSTDT